MMHPPCRAVWMGFIPPLAYYTVIYQAALAKELRLLNSPQEHRRAMEFDHFYPRLQGLTPESRVVATVAEALVAAHALGFPLFLKGVVKSAKDRGRAACVAHSARVARMSLFQTGKPAPNTVVWCNHMRRGEERMQHYIFLDPDGTQGIGLLIVVAAPTGIVYAHQCAGIYTEVRDVEGFMIPLGAEDLALVLHRFFQRRFHGNPPRPEEASTLWRENDLHDLDEIITQIAVWDTDAGTAGEFHKAHPALDRTRLAELTEAWIPVTTVYGPGILMFDNSD